MENEKVRFSFVRWIIASIIIMLILRMCINVPSGDTRAYVIYLKEPVHDVAELAVNQDEYRWTNYGATIEVYRFGRTLIIPASNIRYIEAWDQNSIIQEEVTR